MPTTLFFIVFAMTMSHVAVERAVFEEGTAPRVHSRQRAYDGRVDFVVVPVAVTDSAGRSVTGLRQSDFEIFEDGVPREIRHFATGCV